MEQWQRAGGEAYTKGQWVQWTLQGMPRVPTSSASVRRYPTRREAGGVDNRQTIGGKVAEAGRTTKMRMKADGGQGEP